MNELSDEKLAEIIRINTNRKYANYFDWKDKKIKKFGIVNHLLNLMEGRGERDCEVEDFNEPPDVVAVDKDGRKIGIEVAELVFEEAVRRNQQGEEFWVFWTLAEVVRRISEIIIEKDAKTFKGGPYVAIRLVIHPDEPTIISVSGLARTLMDASFENTRNIDEVFLLDYSSYVRIKLCRNKLSENSNGNQRP